MKNINRKITVHIADDHEIIIDGLTAILEFEYDIEVIGHSVNGSEALDWFNNFSADILLLDLNMPSVAGLDVIKEIKKYKAPPKIIVLSSYDDIKLIKDVLKLGVKSFVPKKSAGEHLVNAIRNIANGKQYFTEDVKERMMNAILHPPKQKGVQIGTTLINSLTKRQREILNLITLEFTTKEISEKLFISVSTVETHRKNLIKKVNVKNSIGLALFALMNDIK